MIKKNTRKVIFGKKKESDHFCLCNPGIMGFGILFSAPEGNQESVTVTINKNPESKFHWQVIWNPIYFESGIHLTRSVESRIQECLLLPYVGPVANPAEGPAGPASRLFLDQTEARSAETRSPFHPGVDDPSPLPPYLKVWIRHWGQYNSMWLSQFSLHKVWKKSCNTNNTFKRFFSLIFFQHLMLFKIFIHEITLILIAIITIFLIWIVSSFPSL